MKGMLCNTSHFLRRSRYAHALRRVTFGVTWGKQGYASASSSSPKLAEAKPVTSSAGSRVTCEPNGGRGKFVEIISSPARRMAPKPLKKMVGTTGIEPVTPTMSRKGSVITLNFRCLPSEFNALILHEIRKSWISGDI